MIGTLGTYIRYVIHIIMLHLEVGIATYKNNLNQNEKVLTK